MRAGEVKLLKREIAAALKGREWTRALERAEQLCAVDPQDARAWFHCGYCLARLGRFADALPFLERSVAIDPSVDKVLRLRDRVRSRLEYRPKALDPAATRIPQPLARAAPSGAGRDQHDPATTEHARVALTRAAARSRHGAARQSSTLPTGEGEWAWSPGSVVAGRYEVRDMIRGGMGVVYIVRDRELDRLVAVKTPLPSSLATDEGRARFQREAESWIALGMHPYICTAHYVQEIGGVPRLFIEHVDGGGLDEWLRSRELTIEQRLDIAIQVAEGMAYTHTFEWTDEDGVEHHGLIHRDLKPANVLMSSDGTARVTDFGLVRSQSAGDEDAGADGPLLETSRLGHLDVTASASGSWQTVTQAGGILGTPPYMAPELWRPSQRASASCDVYAFGCILYELVCSRKPFLPSGGASTREAQLTQWLRMHLTEQPPDPTELAPGLDGDVGALILACVAKEPGDRPQSFAVISDRLRQGYGRVVGQPYPRPQPRRATLLADSLNNRAVSYLTLGRIGSAEHCFHAALQSEPGHLEATLNLALYRLTNGDLNDAELLRRFEQAAHGADEPGRIAHLLGRLQLFLGRADAAVDALRAAPHENTPARDLGLALLALSRSRNDSTLASEAEQTLSAALEASPSDLECAVGLAVARERLGRDPGRWRQTPELPESLDEAAALVLPGHDSRRMALLPGRVEALDCHRERVLARCGGTTLCLLDATSGEALQTLRIPGPARREPSVGFMSASLVVVNPGDGPLAIWDLESGRLARQLRPHPAHVTALAIDQRGLRALTGGSDRRLRLWDLTTGECVQTLEGHGAFVASVAFGADGTTALSSSGDGAARVWRLRDGQCLRTLEGHDGTVTTVLALADGRLLTAGEDGTLRLWPSTDEAAARVLRGHDGPVSAAVALPGGEVVCTVGADHTVRSWHVGDGVPLHVVRFSGPVGPITAGALGTSPVVGRADCLVVLDGERLSRASRAPFVLTAPLSTGELEQRRSGFDGHICEARRHLAEARLEEALAELRLARAVPGYELHPEALGLWAQVLVRFPKRTVRAVAEVRSIHSPGGPLVGAVLPPAGERAVTAGADGVLRLWDMTTISVTEIGRHGSAISSLAQSEDGSVVVTASRDGEIRLWRSDESVCVQEPGADAVTVNALAVLPDESSVVSGGADGGVRVHATDLDGQLRLLGSHHEPVTALACSADGRLVVSGGVDCTVMVWDGERGTQLHSLRGHQGAITALAFSPECRRVASADDTGSIRVFDIASRRCVRVLAGHPGGTTSLSCSPDARFLASAGRDGSLRLWDLLTGSCLRTVEAHTATVTSVVFSADGSSLLSASADGSARLWILDWEPDPRVQEDWDERARPFLEVFLRRHQQPEQPTPQWHESDLENLLGELERRGFGWIATDRVRRELERLLLGWAEQRASEQAHLDREHRRQMLRERAAPVESALIRLTRNLGLRLGVVVLLAIALVLLVQAVRVPHVERAGFNDTLRPEYRERFNQRCAELAAGATIPAYHLERPDEPDPSCDGVDWAALLDVVLAPGEHGTAPLDAHRESGGAEFRLRYRQGLRCLPGHADESALTALLAEAAAPAHPTRREDLLGVLVRLDSSAEPMLGAALADSDANVRHVAAQALVYRTSPTALELLLAALKGSDDRAREAAMLVLRELLLAGAIDDASAFQLIQDGRFSIDPRLRRWGIRALVLYQETDPVRELLDEALTDPDEGVRNEARVVRGLIREARRKQLFGR